MQNLKQSAIKKYGSEEKIPSELAYQFEQCLRHRAELNELNDEKKIRSAEIGRLRKAGEDASDKIHALSQMKEAIKARKELVKVLEEQIASHLLADANDALFPVRFLTAESAPLPADITDVKVLRADELKDKDVDNFVQAQTQSSLYHLSPWRRLIQTVFGHTDISLVAVNGRSEIVGLLPLIHMQSKMFGNFASSLPYFNYGGPLTTHPQIADVLIEAAKQYGMNTDLQHIELREMHPRHPLPAKTEKVCMLRKLPNSIEELDDELGTKLRAQIKRSQDKAPGFVVGKAELVDDFYAVFSENMRDLGTPVYSKQFFRKIFHIWPEHAHIVVVYLYDKPVACGFLLGYKDTLEIPWASALRSTNAIGINMFMYWKILCFAIQSGYQYFDFGRSSSDSGTYRFKAQWGAKPIQNYWNYWLPEHAELPQINPNNPKYQLVIFVWKRLPLFLTNLIGPYIVKNIP